MRVKINFRFTYIDVLKIFTVKSWIVVSWLKVNLIWVSQRRRNNLFSQIIFWQIISRRAKSLRRVISPFWILHTVWESLIFYNIRFVIPCFLWSSIRLKKNRRLWNMVRSSKTIIWISYWDRIKMGLTIRLRGYYSTNFSFVRQVFI